MGGSRIFRAKADDPNVSVILESLTQDGGEFIMAQRYIPEITQGDKRILVVDGEAVPYALARIPAQGKLAAISPQVARVCRCPSPSEIIGLCSRSRLVLKRRDYSL